VASEFMLDLCFIREEHAEAPFLTLIDRQLNELFSGKGTWYIEHKMEDGLEIAVAEVKGIGTWDCEDDLLAYIEETAADHIADCWEFLQGYNVQVIQKIDAGSCRLKTR